MQLSKCPTRLFIGCLIFLPFLVASRLFCLILVSSIIRVVLGMMSMCECVSPLGFIFPQAHSARFFGCALIVLCSTEHFSCYLGFCDS